VLSAEEYLKLRQPTTGMLRTIGKFKKKGEQTQVEQLLVLEGGK
jgi:hypothetical protein